MKKLLEHFYRLLCLALLCFRESVGLSLEPHLSAPPGWVEIAAVNGASLDIIAAASLLLGLRRAP